MTVGGSFVEEFTFPLYIKCLRTALSIAFNEETTLNSIFTTNGHFHHLQQSVNGTSVPRNAQSHTDEGLGCEEDGHKRRGVSQKGGIFGGETRKKRKCTVHYLVQNSNLIYRRLILGSARGELFFLSYTCINHFCYSRLFVL